MHSQHQSSAHKSCPPNPHNTGKPKRSPRRPRQERHHKACLGRSHISISISTSKPSLPLIKPPTKTKLKPLTIIPSIDRRQNGLIPLTQIPQLPEQDSTFLRSKVPPFGARLESRAGGRDGGVDVFLPGGFDGCDDGFVVGVDGFDFLARGGGDEFVVDEEAFGGGGVSGLG